MKRYAIGAALVLLICGMGGALPVHAELVLNTVSSPAPPRYSVITQDGRKVVTGLCIDIMRAIEKIDPEIRFSGEQQTMPQARASSLMERGELDVLFCLNKNAEREKKFLVVEPALYEVHYKLAVRSDDEVDVQSFDDIRKLGSQGIILVNFDTASVKFLQDIGGLKIDSSGLTQEVNLRKLVGGRGRFYYRHELGLRGELEAGGFSREVKLLPAVLDRQEQFVIFSRSADPAAVARVEKALERLKVSGELAKLKAKY